MVEGVRGTLQPRQATAAGAIAGGFGRKQAGVRCRKHASKYGRKPAGERSRKLAGELGRKLAESFPNPVIQGPNVLVEKCECIRVFKFSASFLLAFC